MFLYLKNAQRTLSQTEILLLCDETRLVKEEFFDNNIRRIFFFPIVTLPVLQPHTDGF